MGDWFTPIAQSLQGNTKQELAMNPAYTGGAAMLNAEAPVIGNNFWSAFLPQIALGAGSGLAMGYGRSQVEDKQKNIADAIASVYAEQDPTKRAALISDSPYLKDLAPQLQAAEKQHESEIADKDREMALLHPDEYAQAVATGLAKPLAQTVIPGNRPEGPLSPEETIRQKIQDRMQERFDKYGGDKQLQQQAKLLELRNSPEMMKFDADRKAAIDRAKLRDDPMGAFSGDERRILDQNGAFARESHGLANKLRDYKDYAQWKAMGAIGGLDPNNLSSIIEANADLKSRILTGAAKPNTEAAFYKKILEGDFSMGPQKIANLIDDMAFATTRQMHGQITTRLGPWAVKKLVEDGQLLEDPGFESAFQKRKGDYNKPAVLDSIPPGYELSGSVDANGNRGIRKIR